MESGESGPAVGPPPPPAIGGAIGAGSGGEPGPQAMEGASQPPPSPPPPAPLQPGPAASSRALLQRSSRASPEGAGRGRRDGGGPRPPVPARPATCRSRVARRGGPARPPRARGAPPAGGRAGGKKGGAGGGGGRRGGSAQPLCLSLSRPNTTAAPAPAPARQHHSVAAARSGRREAGPRPLEGGRAREAARRAVWAGGDGPARPPPPRRLRLALHRWRRRVPGPRGGAPGARAGRLAGGGVGSTSQPGTFLRGPQRTSGGARGV